MGMRVAVGVGRCMWVGVGGVQVPAQIWRSGASAVAPPLVANTLYMGLMGPEICFFRILTLKLNKTRFQTAFLT